MMVLLVPARRVTVLVTLLAGTNNTIMIDGSHEISSIHVSPPQGTFYPSTVFTTSGIASRYNCTPGLCAPVGSKIMNLAQNGSASLTIPRTSNTISGSRYVEITYINNDVATATSWGYGTNTRNITVAVNGATPVRLEAPLSGRSSELFSLMKGWGDSATLGVLVSGFGNGTGEDTIVVGNANGEAGYQPYGADFVGLRIS